MSIMSITSIFPWPQATSPTPHATGWPSAILLALSALVMAVRPCGAASVYSNGTGGGRWSEPATWRGGKMPAPTDDVVIAARDTVVFNLPSKPDADQSPTCASLELDPLGVLTFQCGESDRRLVVAGPVVNYGIIKIDATRSGGVNELRLASQDQDHKNRSIIVNKNAELLLYGAKDAPAGRPNVQITTGGPDAEGERRPGYVQVSRGSLDLQHAGLDAVSVRADNIDNTGYKAHERLNVIGCRFTNGATLAVTSCDTAVVKENAFLYDGKDRLDLTAISLNGCQLGQVTNNTVNARYTRGASVWSDTDSSLTGLSITGCHYGLAWHGSNGMIKRVTVTDCGEGIYLQCSGMLEDVTVANLNAANERAGWQQAIGMKIENCSPQLNAFRVIEPGEKAVPMTLHRASVTMMNCNLPPDGIKLSTEPLPDRPWMETFQFLVVGVKGAQRPDTQVTVRTAGLPEGQPDPNVRNSPAMLLPVNAGPALRMTPLPRSQQPILVRSWALANDGSVQPAPACTIVQRRPRARRVHSGRCPRDAQ
ncbi:MAG TPA: right-handed parallel beta-helix repeat-containing protein, partial [Planctomycetota bacterium]|nr:right-handed parallel beta-helix repeat-containing protein [Planctomycetota bacterium]